jgi:hypothetical protein
MIMSNRYALWDEYGLRHSPRHLLRGKRWQELGKLLTDFEFIEAKCAAGMTYDLVQDCSDCLKASPALSSWDGHKRIADYDQFLRSQAHVLVAHPELVFQLAINQPEDTTPAQDAYCRRGTGEEKRPYFEYHCDL